jgi:serine phosphatase RsbU (regulator of sigma subunit)/CHASE2 domain-containing sensor protein
VYRIITFLKHALLPADPRLLRSRSYIVVAPLAMAAILALISGTAILERLENLTLDLRFRSRAPQDPPADSRLVLVAVDQDSLDRFGRWPWPRARHGDFCTLLSVNDPAVVTFDLLFTDKGEPEDEAHFAEGAKSLPRIITGAVTDRYADPIAPAAAGRTKPITSIVGDIQSITGNNGALIPVPGLAAVSSFGFVDANPSPTDGIRRRLPLLLRVGNQVYPSLALQTLLHYWDVSPGEVQVRLGKWLELPSPEGRKRIPITEAGEMWLNYRAMGTFSAWPYEALFRTLYLDATGEVPFPKDAVPVKGKILVIGQTATALTDLGPSPLDGQSPLVLTSLNALNSIFKGDYLRVIPLWPWPLLAWLAVAWATLIGGQNQNVARSLLIPLGVITVYVGAAWILFGIKSIALPIAGPVLGLALVTVGKVIIEWIDEIYAERRATAELVRATEAKKLLEQELEIAREIQFSTLPRIFPPFPERPEIDLHAIMIPAKYVGGDLYEFFFVDTNKLFFVIGDVSGKGVPAALFMTMALAVIRSHVIAGRSPSETLRRSNNVLALRNERCTFVTIFCGLLDTETGRVVYSNGGHNPPVVLDGEGGVRFLEAEGTAIGAIEGLEFEERELVLKPNQGLFLYTDGVTEAINRDEVLFEEERLTHALTVRHSTLTAEAITTRLHDQLSTFVGDAPQFDDITALTLFYRGPSVN